MLDLDIIIIAYISSYITIALRMGSQNKGKYIEKEEDKRIESDLVIYRLSDTQGGFNCSSLPAGLGENGEYLRKFGEI